MKKALQHISSSQNPSFKSWKELSQSRGVKEQKQFFLMGEKLIAEFLKKPQKSLEVKAQLFPEGHAPLNLEAPAYSLTPTLFDQLDVLGTHEPLLLLAYSGFSQFDETTSPEGLELVIPLGDPGNLGALVRSAVAFGVKRIILTQESCHPFHPKALKASAGASLNVEFVMGPSLSQWKIHNEDWVLHGLGRDLREISWPKNFRLIVGEEGPGVKFLEKIPAERGVRIPTQNVESLNATVAVSLTLYEWSMAKNRGSK